jgi:hypothetical protein
MIKQAFETWKSRFETNSMNENEYSWLSSIASELGMKDFAQQVRDSKPTIGSEKMYNSQNLTVTSKEEGLTKN